MKAFRGFIQVIENSNSIGTVVIVLHVPLMTASRAPVDENGRRRSRCSKRIKHVYSRFIHGCASPQAREMQAQRRPDRPDRTT